METMTDMDCYEAETAFAELIERRDLLYTVATLPDEKQGNVRFLRFAITISDGRTEIFTPYSAGEGLAYSWAKDLPIPKLRRIAWCLGECGSTIKEIRQALTHGARRTIYVEGIRSRVRAAYRPTLADVMQCLVRDAQYSDDPQEFGELFDNGAEAIEAWQQIQTNAPKVRALLGPAWNEAVELVAQI
jgi:hypothetical protein